MAATKLPPEAVRLAQAHRARQQKIAGRAVQASRRLWRFRSTSGWSSVAGRLLTLVSSALVEAARGSQDYVAAVLQAQGADPDPFGEVPAGAFGKSASDGRDLASLLAYPDFEASSFVDGGMLQDQASAVAQRHLERIVATQVADAARVSTGVAVVNDRAAKGYVRLLTLPSCNRCIILAGQFYRFNDGFERHPQCDCVHQPAAEVVEPPSPREVYDSLSDEDRRKAGWSGHDQRAIDDGAALNQVTNAKRALKSVSIAGRQVKATGVGTTKRSLAGQRLRAAGAKRVVRFTPEQIYLDADREGLSREETVAVLKRHGYIV